MKPPDPTFRFTLPVLFVGAESSFSVRISAVHLSSEQTGAAVERVSPFFGSFLWRELIIVILSEENIYGRRRDNWVNPLSAVVWLGRVAREVACTENSHFPPTPFVVRSHSCPSDCYFPDGLSSRNPGIPRHIGTNGGFPFKKRTIAARCFRERAGPGCLHV